MPDPSITELIRDTGYGYWNGNPIGYLQDGVHLAPNYVISPLYSEDRGMIPQDFIYSGATTTLKFSINSINIQSFLMAFVQRTSNSFPNLTLPGTLKTGNVVSVTSKGTFLFVPQNPAHPNLSSSDCFGFLNGFYSFNYQNLTNLSLTVYCKTIISVAK